MKHSKISRRFQFGERGGNRICGECMKNGACKGNDFNGFKITHDFSDNLTKLEIEIEGEVLVCFVYYFYKIFKTFTYMY